MKIKSIKSIGYQDCQCIKVNAKDELYVTGDINSNKPVITHNTFIYVSMSELGWWEQMGWTRENIFRFFSKATQRVDSRMSGHYLGRSIIDSSPFSMESPIDKWIYNEALNDPKWYCVTGARWDWFKKDYKDFYDKNGNEIHTPDVAFQCYKGGKSEPPKYIKNEAEASTYDPLDLIWCPRYAKTSKGVNPMDSLAKQNCVEFLRDWAGIPAGSSDRIFQAGSTIENIFDNELRNMYTSVTADADEEPEHLIWNKINKQFFIDIAGKKIFYREPNAKRALAIDQSITGDATGIGMTHMEYIRDPNNPAEVKNICVVDFTIVIIPKGGRINLEAIKSFILDLVDLGGINLGVVSFDTFQSETSKQALRRHNIALDYISVDKSNEPYISLIDYINHGRFVAGRSLFLKNNLRSLHWAKRESGTTKCDHFEGKITNESADTDWNTSEIGTNAKDAADTCASCLTLMLKNDLEFMPTTEWVPRHNHEAATTKLQKLGLVL